MADSRPAGAGIALAGSALAAGQGLVEYGLILALMAIVCVVSLLFFGDQLSSLLSLIASFV
jgi:Flp pilus assembly pilin Flp